MHVLTVELVYWSVKGNFNYLLKNSLYKGDVVRVSQTSLRKSFKKKQKQKQQTHKQTQLN